MYIFEKFPFLKERKQASCFSLIPSRSIDTLNKACVKRESALIFNNTYSYRHSNCRKSASLTPQF